MLIKCKYICHLNKSYLNGSTGSLYFDKQGKRSNFTFNVVTLNKNGLEKVGKWTTDNGLKTDNYLGFTKNLNNKPGFDISEQTLKVAVVMVSLNLFS